jgi:hypothetical protein
LKYQLCRDLKELVKIADLRTAGKYEKVLLKLAHKYYDIYDYDDPKAWFLNDNAKEVAIAKLKKGKKRFLKN